MEKLQTTINYFFKDKNLLKVALTHSSYSNEAKETLKNNERLEFLGDSVISLIVANHLFEMFPNETEGELTKVRAFFVCDNSLSTFAEKIDLGSYLKVGKGEEQAGVAEKAFHDGCAILGYSTDFPKARDYTLKSFTDALLDLAYSSPHLKKLILQACWRCILHDGAVTERESALLSVVAAALGAPAPIWRDWK